MLEKISIDFILQLLNIHRILVNFIYLGQEYYTYRRYLILFIISYLIELFHQIKIKLKEKT